MAYDNTMYEHTMIWLGYQMIEAWGVVTFIDMVLPALAWNYLGFIYAKFAYITLMLYCFHYDFVKLMIFVTGHHSHFKS